jgi:hypothetical protein
MKVRKKNAAIIHMDGFIRYFDGYARMAGELRRRRCTLSLAALFSLLPASRQ